MTQADQRAWHLRNGSLSLLHTHHLLGQCVPTKQGEAAWNVPRCCPSRTSVQSTALLTELQRLLPSVMRYQMITFKGNRLELTGEVREPRAVETLNSFQLKLDASSFFERDGLVLERADAAGSGAGSEAPVTLTYQFVGELSAAAVEATRPRLVELKAFGLAKRLLRLRQEGLLE